MEEKDLEVIEMVLEDGYEGVYAISLVNDPAIKSDFIFLSAEKVLLKVIDEEKRIVTGALLIPNQEILRKNKDGKKYKIFFNAETINSLSQKFMKDHNNSNFTVEHQTTVPDIEIAESWIKLDAERDKSVALGIDVPVGTWIVTAKINNDEVWENQVKTGLISGFSVEARMQRKSNVNLKNVLSMSEKSMLEKLQGFITNLQSPEIIEAKKVESEVVKAAEDEAVIAPVDGVIPEEGAEETPTYVSVEEFADLQAMFNEQQLVLEAIVDYIGDGMKPAEQAVIEGEAIKAEEAEKAEAIKAEEVKAAAIKAEEEKVLEEEVKASKIKKEEDEKAEFLALKSVKNPEVKKLKKFDDNLTVAERIAINFK